MYCYNSTVLDILHLHYFLRSRGISVVLLYFCNNYKFGYTFLTHWKVIYNYFCTTLKRRVNIICLFFIIFEKDKQRTLQNTFCGMHKNPLKSATLFYYFNLLFMYILHSYLPAGLQFIMHINFCCACTFVDSAFFSNQLQ